MKKTTTFIFVLFASLIMEAQTNRTVTRSGNGLGEIIYTDIQDTTAYFGFDFYNFYGIPYDLFIDLDYDMNQIKTKDIVFHFEVGWHFMIGAGICFVVDSDWYGYYAPGCFFHDNMSVCHLGDTISTHNGEWVGSYSLRPWTTYFEHPDEDVLVLRKRIEDDFYYAWVRVGWWGDEATKECVLTLYEWAYCTIPNYPLVAGQKSLDITSTEENHISGHNITPFPNPSGGMVSVVLPEGASGAQVELFSLDGRLVMSEPWVTGGIDISRLATGIYIMRVATDNGVTFEEKVVRE